MAGFLLLVSGVSRLDNYVDEFDYLVIYDGDCNLCATIVKFIIPRDRSGVIRFAALQSETARQWEAISSHPMPEDIRNTFIWIERGRIYIKSTAALRMVRRLSGVWPLLSIFLLIPTWVRDPFYTLVASNRYRWFGKRESCLVAVAEYRDRFLV